MHRQILLFILPIALGGCAVHPKGEAEERAAAMALEKHDPPILPANPSPDDLVKYALLANADLESRYWQWRSAIEQIPQDASQASSVNVALGALISNGASSSDMTSLTVGNDPMTDLKWPSKLDVAGRIALQNARAAGIRFRGAQFDLRNKVISAYYDYAQNAELARLEETNHQLLQATAAATEARNRAGSAGQQDVLRTKNDVDISSNDIANMKSQFPAQRATLNAFLSRAPDAPLPVPDTFPQAKSLTLDDAQLLALVAQRNPELAALAAESQGKKDAIQLAKLQYFPDFNLSAGTDLAGATQTLLAQLTIPIFRKDALNAAIAQAQANLHAAEASRRQNSNDLAARVVIDISTIRDADRQLDLFEKTILPRAHQVVDLSRSSYEAGRATLLDLLDSQRTFISVERLVVNLRVMRAKRIADLEAIAGRDLDQ